MGADETPDASADAAARRAGGAASRWLLSGLLLLPPPLVLLAVGLLTPTSELFPHQGDVQLYLRRAADVASGAVPYVDFPFEYPPFALLPMAVPYLLSPVGAPDLEAYRWLFLGWQMALLAALGLVLRRIVSLGALDAAPAAVALRLTVLTAAAALPLAWRYDLFPALFAAIAVGAALGGRAGGAGLAVGVGALAKLFPVVILPALAVRSLAARDPGEVVRLGLATGLAVVAGFLPFAAVAGQSALGFLGYHSGRGLQIESIGGGLAMLSGIVRGEPVELVHNFGAVHVTGAFAEAWLAVLPLVAALGFGGVGVATLRSARAWRDGEVPASVVVTLATAWLLALLVTSKVFSVQYVVWLVPFAALLPRGQLLLAATICALSMGVHPLGYEGLVAGDAGPILLLNLRNALVVALFSWTLLDLARGRARRDPA